MPFWSSDINPLQKYRFEVTIDGAFSFLAKSVNKPTLETDVNEYRLINQIIKFPTIPKWNDITIKYVDVQGSNLTKALVDKMKMSGQKHESVEALEKGDVNLVITQYKTDGKPHSTWTFTNSFIKSINFGDNEYSSDDLVEIDVIIAYDWAELT